MRAAHARARGAGRRITVAAIGAATILLLGTVKDAFTLSAVLVTLAAVFAATSKHRALALLGDGALVLLLSASERRDPTTSA